MTYNAAATDVPKHSSEHTSVCVRQVSKTALLALSLRNAFLLAHSRPHLFPLPAHAPRTPASLC